MATLALDTHRLVTSLKHSGFTEQQAIGITEALQAIDLANVTTKGDLEILERDLTARLRELELRMTIKLGALIVAGIGVLAALKLY